MSGAYKMSSSRLEIMYPVNQKTSKNYIKGKESLYREGVTKS